MEGDGGIDGGMEAASSSLFACLQPPHSELPLSLGTWGMVSDDSDFSIVDNICVSKLFYLPTLPLTLTTLSHCFGGLHRFH